METQKRAAHMDGGGHRRDGDLFGKLPSECLTNLLSFTTPRDLCRLAVVSKSFLSAAESDASWECFLPPDYADILSQAVHPVEISSSKKELYFRLCKPILLGDGKMSFQLERSTGKKTYMISAEKMGISWVHHPRYWRWISLPESRFGKVAKLITVGWLHIHSTISSRLLSQKTVYVVYIVFKLAVDAYGLDAASQVAYIKLGTYISEKRISLLPEDEAEDDDDDDGSDSDSDEKKTKEAEKDIRRLREDSWLELSLGEFYNDEGDDGNVVMRLKETTEEQWKQGLILLGFELRPKVT